MYIGYGTLVIDNSIISGNSALLEVGGILTVAETTITNSLLYANSAVGDGGALSHMFSSASITDSCIVGNSGDGVTTFAVRSYSPGLLTAINNWWGAADGPGPVGPGSGDTVSPGVLFDPFLTSNLVGAMTCPFLPPGPPH
jgi:hypothetical protein